MSALTRFAPTRTDVGAATTPDTAAALYHALLASTGRESLDGYDVAEYLRKQLRATESLECDLPQNPADFSAWVAGNVTHVADQYGDYLKARRAGAPRQFFSNTVHALYFLQRVAPTKLVDGAWLYSTLKHAEDLRYHGLIRTYLEELGDGDPGLNHISLYRSLLAEHDCAPTHGLDDELYVAGAVQLALAYAGEEFLPEVIGYNLGYEQLPLHLLITAFELNELGIDPYYFTLHVTIDNASTGHAQKAVQAVEEFMLAADDPQEFLQRVRAGYRLNELGVGTKAIIDSFDLEHEVVQMLERKRSFGQHMHSDYCRLEGRTVNEWLATPGQIPEFLRTLENKGWIKRDQDPELCRFWQLIAGPGAAMFGVFSGYEMQLLRDWIAGSWSAEAQSKTNNPFRARFRNRNDSPVVNADLPSHPPLLATLLPKLSPALHPTPSGLAATRLFAGTLSKGGFAG